jgi:hypothetical protein
MAEVSCIRVESYKQNRMPIHCIFIVVGVRTICEQFVAECHEVSRIENCSDDGGPMV